MWENFVHWDPYDKESVEGSFELFEGTFKFGLERKMGPGMERTNAASRGPDGRATPKEERERILSSAPPPVVFRYQRKIKEAFDPNGLGDSYYLTPEEPEKPKLGPSGRT